MTRRRLNLNREWRFFRGDVQGAAARDFDDSAWEPVGLPHAFDLPYFRTPEFYVGYGWYRKRFALVLSPKERAFLEFDGTFQVAEVFVNGIGVGSHRGGYTGFALDVTDAVHAGENVLAVRVNNLWDAKLQPRAGEHVFCGGIYRDVHLVVKNAVHVTWNGTRISTPAVSNEIATIEVQTEVHNASDSAKDCHIETHIIGPDPRVGLSPGVTESFLLEPGETLVVKQSEVVGNPRLWHPDHPHLYRVRSEIFDFGELVDAVETPLGFRWFQWTSDRGFFLNGEHLYLRGANAHQDHAGWGIGITRAACERDARLIKDAGFNFVRGAHYPHHPAFADACDRLGLIFWSENAFWGKGGFGPEGYWNASAYPANPDDFQPFDESCKQQLAEMIRINRNHPSIVVWSMTNEAFFTYHLDRAKHLMRELVDLSHALDPTRPAAIGGAQRGDVDQIGDVAGYNGDGARLFVDPGVPSMVSEYGAINKPHEAYDPFFGDLVGPTPALPFSPRQQRDAGSAPIPEEFPWRGGQAIWAAFDYGSIAGKQGLKGIVNHQRLPKRSWYWYRNEYRATPAPPDPIDAPPAGLRIDADKTTIIGTDATDDCQLIVTVLDGLGRHVSATPAVTLTIESGPGEFPTGRSITFAAGSDIEIVQGQCAIAFRSYHGGTSLIRAISPGLDDATITITTQGEPQYVEGVTPLPPGRPYLPPPMSSAAVAAMSNAVNVALNRPCRGSTESEAHAARLANDGDRSTAWRASGLDRNPWWMIDLEGFYQLASLRLVFETDGNFRFVVELSPDQQMWTPAIDRSGTENIRAERSDVFPPGVTTRYVRVRFVGVPPDRWANLGEVEIHGILAVR